MIRQIIHIDEEKCNGCGLCAEACHESAIAIIDGKAKLIREIGLKYKELNRKPAAGAISFETREAAAYDEAAVEENKKRKQAIMQESKVQLPHSCPGSTMRQMNRQSAHNASENTAACESVSMLTNWPVQIKLAPIQAPYFNGAKLLIAADCTAYSYAAFHKDFIKGKTTLIGCPKLDDIDYSEKLTEIIRNNDISSVTIVRMEVPCCGGLEIAAKKAIQASGKFLPWQVVTISIDGNIIE